MYMKLFSTRLIAAIIVMTICMAKAVDGYAQELNCKVEINSSQVQGTNKSMFTTLEQAINEYMNTTDFTNAKFAVNEKIDCRLFFTIKDVNDNVFTGDLQVQSTRPVYNSSYTTTVLNFKDTKSNSHIKKTNLWFFEKFDGKPVDRHTKLLCVFDYRYGFGYI